MASSMGGMFSGQQQQQQQPPGAHPPLPGPGASGNSRTPGNTLVDDLEASFEVRTRLWTSGNAESELVDC